MSEYAVAQQQNTNTSKRLASNAVNFQRKAVNHDELTALPEWKGDALSGCAFAEPRFGHDFSGVPAFTGMAQQARSLLRTQPMVQRFPRDGASGSSSCPTCSEAKSEQISTNSEPTAEAAAPAPEAAPTPVPSEPTEETATPGEIALPGLIVEDSATELAPGQMKKSEFLSQLRVEVCRTVEAALVGTGRTTDDCPYLNHWFDFYSRKESAHIERSIHRYAPDASSVTTARGYISVIAQRARQAAETWASTGEITGVPEGVPTTVPGEAPAESGEGASTLMTIPVMFKAREGGARASDDPQAIQAELGDGQPLNSGVRSRMKSAFVTDFSHVRTHTDTTAAGLSSRLNARAFTVGKHIAFGSGEYKPGTLIGDALIAHEIAHVIQQGGYSNSIATMQTGNNSYNAFEDDADMSAIGAMVTLWGSAKASLADIAQNAIPSLRSGLRLQRCDDCGGAGCPTTRPGTPAPTTTPAPPSALPTITGILTAQDNFSGRSTTEFALAEVIDLSFTSSPSRTASQLGGLKWFIDSGGGTLTGGNDGRGSYTAGDTSGAVRLVLKVVSGPNRGTIVATKDITIVAPSGSYMTQQPATGIWHVRGRASVGFKGLSFLEPRDVSFSNIERREGRCTGTGTGFFAGDTGQVHPVGSWMSVGRCNSSTGCLVLTVDTVQTGPHSGPYSHGTFSWPIPRQYRVGSGSAVTFTTANHEEEVDSTGRATIRKHGAGPFSRALNDPSSSY